jgi:Leucine-rich repeat (LRR) protein
MEEPQKPSREVLDKIAQAKHEQSKTLVLAGYEVGKLLEIPDEVFELSQLEELRFFGTSISKVPERIRELRNLKELSLYGNPIREVPDIPGLCLDWGSFQRCRPKLSAASVCGLQIRDRRDSGRPVPIGEHNFLDELKLLPNLRDLRISNDLVFNIDNRVEPTRKLAELFAAFDQLQALDSLFLTGLVLESVPLAIRNLKGLKRLYLHNSGLQQVPEWLGGLESLEELGLGWNNLTSLPSSLERLSKLKIILLYANRFSEIPSVLFGMRSLTEVSFMSFGAIGAKGLIKQVPADILNLPALETFDVEGHPIQIPPPEVVKQGVQAIKNYWRQQQEVGVDYLCEAKLIILGEAGAGKSSLAKKIQDPTYELQPQEPSTEGIDVLRWSFPSAIRIKQDGKEKLHNTEFKVNIWDFGGQEIYHATHQFFLTRRSLYALVSDDRKEDTDFNYWLQVVELLSDQSPLLIVQNEKQDRQRDLDLAGLRADFSNLRGALRTNLADNRGLNELVKVIRQELEQLPHIGTPLPKTWSRVRAALEEDTRNYISLDEYFSICRDNGLKRREDNLQLSGYLHDLGICLHFQDDPILKNRIILKPKWGTDAAYRVLDDRVILNNRGRFGLQDLARIWVEDQYSEMRDELLRLMMKFQLCYQLPSPEAYIAPQLVSPTRPTYDWDNTGGLVLRYDYDFMPKGILTRFIVALNHLIADQDLVWKSGVILERDDSRAEVIEDYIRRKITVRVNGPNSRGLLAIVDDQLERIHASFPRLKYDKFLPCNCEVCQTRDEPSAYSLSELKDFAAHGDKIQCRISRKPVDAAGLIRDVLPSAAYLPNPHPPRLQLDTVSQETSNPVAIDSREVFVSYAWSDESAGVVDKVQAAFQGQDIVLVRDKNDVRYKDSIRSFMERIGRGKCIVVVLSKKYLESKSCMFELTEIAARGEIRDRVFPIVLDDANIYEGVERVRYVKYWEEKKKELNAAMKDVDGENLEGIRDELDLFAKIRNTIAGIVAILGDMNALTPDQHQGSNFESLIRALEARLAD